MIVYSDHTVEMSVVPEPVHFEDQRRIVDCVRDPAAECVVVEFWEKQEEEDLQKAVQRAKKALRIAVGLQTDSRHYAHNVRRALSELERCGDRLLGYERIEIERDEDG